MTKCNIIFFTRYISYTIFITHVQHQTNLNRTFTSSRAISQQAGYNQHFAFTHWRSKCTHLLAACLPATLARLANSGHTSVPQIKVIKHINRGIQCILIQFATLMCERSRLSLATAPPPGRYCWQHRLCFRSAIIRHLQSCGEQCVACNCCTISYKTVTASCGGDTVASWRIQVLTVVYVRACC